MSGYFSSTHKALAAIGLGLLLAANQARATLLLEGGVVALTGTTVDAEPQLRGDVLEDRFDTFRFTGVHGVVSGRIQSRVLRAIDGTLDFYWQVSNDVNSSDDLGSLRLCDLFTDVYRVNWRSDGTGNAAPTAANRFTGAQSSCVNFSFYHDGIDHGLAPAQMSYFFFLDTDARSYDTSGIMDVADLQHTHISSLFNTFAPTQEQVPEPGSLALVAAALGAMAARRRR